jgi:hypothetical protein
MSFVTFGSDIHLVGIREPLIYAMRILFELASHLDVSSRNFSLAFDRSSFSHSSFSGLFPFDWLFEIQAKSAVSLELKQKS